MIEELDEEQNPIFKIGGHFQRSAIANLDEIWKKPLTEKEQIWSKDNLLTYFQLLNLPIQDADLVNTDGYSCVYSLTSTEVPYVTYIPMQNKQPNLNFVVLGGLSGVGAKGAMTYGLIAANLLLDKKESSSMYQEVSNRLGFERLLADMEANE